jgi:hypothetical protein
MQHIFLTLGGEEVIFAIMVVVATRGMIYLA